MQEIGSHEKQDLGNLHWESIQEFGIALIGFLHINDDDDDDDCFHWDYGQTDNLFSCFKCK